MITLVLSVPSRKQPSLEAMCKSGKGPKYAISELGYSMLNQGSTVVLIRKDKNQRRVEGILINLKKSRDTSGKIEKTPQGIQRYDVYFKNNNKVPYKPEKLNLWGVAVYDSRTGTRYF